MDTLYTRLLEGIGEGISAALTRKPLEEIPDGDSPLEIIPPQDSSAFGKHTRLWHWMDGFVHGNLKDFISSGRDFSVLSKEDMTNLSVIFRGEADAETMEIAKRNGIPEIFEPLDDDDVREICKTWTDMSWLGILNQKAVTYTWLGVSFITPDGEIRPMQDFRPGDKALYIRFTNKLLNPDTDTDDSIIISRDWRSQVRELEWQLERKKVTDRYAEDDEDFSGLENTEETLRETECGSEFSEYLKEWMEEWMEEGDTVPTVTDYLPAMGHAGGIVPEPLGNLRFRGYLPAIGQLTEMSRNIVIINKALEMTGSETFDLDAFDEDMRGYWWSSSEISDSNAWYIAYGKPCTGDDEYGEYNDYDKTNRLNVLPFFAISGHRKGRRHVTEGRTLNALTRKPVEGIPSDGMDVNVPEDASSFSKHSRGWHLVRNFIDSGGYDHELSMDDFLDPVTCDEDTLDEIIRNYRTYDREARELVISKDIPGFARTYNDLKVKHSIFKSLKSSYGVLFDDVRDVIMKKVDKPGFRGFYPLESDVDVQNIMRIM